MIALLNSQATVGWPDAFITVALIVVLAVLWITR